jgi:G:T/U-mismatch repair DNA glycosylase
MNYKQGDNMKTQFNIRSTIIAAMVAFTAMACSSSGSESEAIINGSIQSEQSSAQKSAPGNEFEPDGIQNASGVAVMAARVTSNGSFETISGTQTTTNASGQFSIAVDVKAAQHIVIIAQQSGTQWMGYLSAQVENGKTYTLKPITAESTAETKVFARLVATGNAAMVQKADVEAAVSARAAASINTSTTAVNAIAAGLHSAAQARAEFYSKKVANNANQQLNAAIKAMSQAQFSLEANLASATSVEARESAYEAFVSATFNAYVQAGLNAEKAAQLIDIWARVILNSTASTSAEVRNDVRASVATFQSFAIDAAVRAEAQASGVSQTTIQAVTEAGVKLRNSVKASLGVKSEVEAAFNTYREEVEQALESDSNINAEVYIQIRADLNGNTGAGTIFRTAISSTTSATVINTAYTTFTTAVQSTVSAHMNGGNTAQVQAFARVVALLYMGS